MLRVSIRTIGDRISIVRTISCLGTLLLAFCPGIALAEQSSLNIDKGWVIKTGDDQAWAEPDFDDGTWKGIRIGTAWEEAGFADYDGYAWYRARFVVPKEWRKHKSLREAGDSGFLVLSLGPIDDADVTYFNGVKIGSTGIMPPDYAGDYLVKRRYRVPLNAVRWGESNVIAVRVYDHEGPGGIYEGPVVVTLPQIDDIINLTFKLGMSNGIYTSPGSLPVTLKIANNSSKELSLMLECALKSDLFGDDSVIKSVKTGIDVGQDDDVDKIMIFDPPEPGFYRVTCAVTDSENRSAEKSMFFGYDPEKIETELTREDDFDDFWITRKRELKDVDPRFKVTRSDRSSDRLDVYLVEMRSHGDVRIRGWFTVPTRPGPHPAILSVPGYNSTMWPNMNRKNVATFALNPRGHGNSKDDVDAKGGEYMYLGFDPNRPDKYIYVGAYMDCVRAVDFLESRPEIDKSRIGVEGGSQGGGLSLATAALDPRIAFCAPDIPWLGDWVGYVAASDWPHEH
ncbi:MAG: acetylxylan esterase, partial [Planctomycetota bacterium]